MAMDLELDQAPDAPACNLAPSCNLASPDFDPELPRKTRSKRHNLFIRAGKLVSPHGEFVCIVRDVSETGVGVRFFHEPPTGDVIELHMPEGGIYPIHQVRRVDNHVGYKFVQRIDLSDFLDADPAFPKRGLRLNLAFPVTLRTLTGVEEGVVENLSQHGARFSSEGCYAIDQRLRVDCPEVEINFGEVEAAIRWRRDSDYGVVFENTLSLEQFANLAARLQCPQLLRSEA